VAVVNLALAESSVTTASATLPSEVGLLMLVCGW
jgi:hypothetical protein